MDQQSDDLCYALALDATGGVGPVGFLRLAKAFGTARGAWTAGAEAWRAVGAPGAAFDRRVQPDCALVKRRLAELARSGAWALSVFDDLYPPLLREIYDPPPILYGRGDAKVLNRPSIAIVGSRRSTPYGIAHAHRIALALSRNGINIVSGLAVGVDSVAHQGALDGGCTTVAVLGSGTSRIYPAVNEDLAARIVRQGALVSESPPYETPDRNHFPRRNRIISGLVAGVVVLEARFDSGSIGTCKQAMDQGRELFVVPGPAGGPNTGGHGFLRDGATLAEGPEEVLRFLGHDAAGLTAVQNSPRQDPSVPVQWRPVWDAVGHATVHVDDLIIKTGLRSADVLGILLQMELRGLVRQLPGKRFSRRA